MITGRQHGHHGRGHEPRYEGDNCCGPMTGSRCCHESAEHEVHHDSCTCDPRHSDPHGFRRHYFTSEEKIELLDEYLEQLEKEAQGVRERIAELKQRGAGMKPGSSALGGGD